MTRFGEHIGIAFQLADDVLDVTSDSTDLGKTPGTDLREGVRTLPVLHALASKDPADAELQELLSSDLADPERHSRALALLRASDAMTISQTQICSAMPGNQEICCSLCNQVPQRPHSSHCAIA